MELMLRACAFEQAVIGLVLKAKVDEEPLQGLVLRACAFVQAVIGLVLRAKVDEEPLQGLVLRALEFGSGGLVLRASSPILVAPSEFGQGAPSCRTLNPKP